MLGEGELCVAGRIARSAVLTLARAVADPVPSALAVPADDAVPLREVTKRPGGPLVGRDAPTRDGAFPTREHGPPSEGEMLHRMTSTPDGYALAVHPARSESPAGAALVHPAAHRPGVGDPDWAAMRRVLVVRPDNVGDVLMAGPALRSLAAAAPRAAIDVLVSPAGAAAAALLPEVADTVVASVSWQQLPGGPSDVVDPDPDAGLAAELAGRGYDAAVVLTSFSQSPWPAAQLCRRAGIAVRVGTSKEFGGGALTHWVPAPPDEGHQVDRMLAVLAGVGVAVRGFTLHARIGAGLPPAVATRLDGAPYAVIAPGASCPSRRYPPERFAAVGRELAATGLRVVVSGTAREAALVSAAAAGVPGAVVLAGELDLAGLASLFADADVVVANNSGGVHLADAVGTPVVDLFAGTETVGQYAPRSVPARVLTRATACAPCRQIACPFGLECLDVPPGEVADAARELLPA